MCLCLCFLNVYVYICNKSHSLTHSISHSLIHSTFIIKKHIRLFKKTTRPLYWFLITKILKQKSAQREKIYVYVNPLHSLSLLYDTTSNEASVHHPWVGQLLHSPAFTWCTYTYMYIHTHINSFDNEIGFFHIFPTFLSSSIAWT